MFTDYTGDIAYISTFIDVPAPLATARFDDLMASLGTGGGVLVLDSRPTRSSALRSAPGTLRSPRGRNLGTVLVELDVWSEGRTQLGIRPTRDKSGSAAGYFAAGYAVLEELAVSLTTVDFTPTLIARRATVAARRRTGRAVQPA